ncbi:hypothetical protein Fcan01_15541 [Folsomia candida]|uniref:Uncharacterized protein n=1 Tax=Folsomia candida TaxID=158441 RepID=A0A226DXD5_FOLCA|nr:hypothetical protein Fcan01_15541 [Folsomia candida]
MLPSWSVIASIVTIINFLISSAIGVSAESLCNRSEVLDAIKNYLERDDFSEMITKPLVRANPITFWNNVIQIEDICNSHHWPYLSDWVSFGSRDLVFFGLTSGKRALHFCQLVNPIQPEDDFEYGYLNSVLESLLKPKNVEKFDERVNFSLAVRQRFQKDVHNLTLQVQNLTDTLGAVVTRINYHHKDHPSGQLSPVSGVSDEVSGKQITPYYQETN